MSMRILITGCNGFIGRNLSRYFDGDHLVDTISRRELNLLDENAVQKFFEDKKYHLVIHTAIEGGRRMIPDTEDIVYRNISMTYNLLANQDHFDRMITFGSGAELDRRFDINQETNTNQRYPIDFYGLSKSVIHKLCLVEPKLYNFRIFNCFGADENPERMIRNNIEKYVRKEPMTLFSNRLMDFFYIEDLGLMIEYFLKTPNFSNKVVNCVYEDHFRLEDILSFINTLDEYQVPINYFNDSSSNKSSVVDTDYIGESTKLPLDFIGLYDGIRKVHSKIKQTNMKEPI